MNYILCYERAILIKFTIAVKLLTYSKTYSKLYYSMCTFTPLAWMIPHCMNTHHYREIFRLLAVHFTDLWSKQNRWCPWSSVSKAFLLMTLNCFSGRKHPGKPPHPWSYLSYFFPRLPINSHWRLHHVPKSTIAARWSKSLLENRRACGRCCILFSKKNLD